MDARLRELLHDDPWRFGTRVLEVHGNASERAHQVLAHLDLEQLAPPTPK
jgi:hypothetical protein